MTPIVGLIERTGLARAKDYLTKLAKTRALRMLYLTKS